MAIGCAAAACGSKIDVFGPDETEGAGASGAGSGSGAGAFGSGNSSAGGGSTGTGVGAGSGTGGTAGSSPLPPPKDDEWCSDCARHAIESVCEPQWSACENDFACNQLLSCHESCEWTVECNAACDEIIPAAAELFLQMASCVACEACVLPCAETSLSLYCE